MPEEEDMIKLTDISVSYGDKVIYKDFNFEFQEGVNVIIGQSGSGKTTLLNVIANLIDFQGECQTDKVAIVFQTPSLAPVSVYDNVQMVTDNKQFQTKSNKGSDWKREYRSWIEQVLTLAQIDHLKYKRATNLSGGEQQRVSLARAFASNRPVLLLDEPFSSLDYGVKQKLYQTLDTLLNNYAKTVVLVTHDIDEALALGDRVYLLANRPCAITEVAQIDTPRDERDGYSEQTVALRKQLQQLLV